MVTSPYRSIAMNRFRIAPGREEDFLEVWRNRDSHLDEVPGFKKLKKLKKFKMLQGDKQDDHTVFISHSVWDREKSLPRLGPVRSLPQGPRQCQVTFRHLPWPTKFEGYEVVL